jgi:adenosyl cobinamide kinase/adenosyl cobinamide phosphate guanylyltransferase
MIVLVVGGARSGKSEVAEHLAREIGGPVTFVATGVATDPEMAARIEAHRARRPAEWRTVELGKGVDLVGTVASLEGIVLVDALGSWVARAHDMRVDAPALVDAVRARTGSTILVTDEVGLSVHAPTDAGRRFADELGALNTAVAAVADRAVLIVAGRVVPLATVGDALGSEAR